VSRRLNAPAVASVVTNIAIRNHWPNVAANQAEVVVPRAFLRGFLGPIGNLIALVSGICMAVLILISSNLFVLSLVKSQENQKQLAIHVALGATKSQIRRRLIPKACALIGIASASSLLIAFLSNRMILAWASAYLPHYFGQSIPGPLLAVLIALTSLAIVFWVYSPLSFLPDTRILPLLSVERNFTGSRNAKQILITTAVMQLTVTTCVLCLTSAALYRYQIARHATKGLNVTNLSVTSAVIPRESTDTALSVGRLFALATTDLNQEGWAHSGWSVSLSPW
jgi:predicted lysophospholipase L1 biosynthesis ABC-type transport system permease subunit